MSAGEGPDNGWAVHDCGYAPLLTGGRLVRRHDPAWQLDEVGRNTRKAETLQRFVTARAAHDLHHRQPGYGLGYHHSIDARGEISGYPDVHVWTPRPGGQMFRELKRMGKAPRPEQVAVLTALHATGADVGVWWPCCWYSGRIDRELAALAGARPIGGHWAPGLPPQPGQPGYVPWRADGPPPVPAQRRRRITRAASRVAVVVELPGAELPAGFGADGGVGYLVNLPAAGAALDVWLRDHGFPPAVVPYPVRVVVAGAGVAVECRAGGPGSSRVWRYAPLCRSLDDLADTVHAGIISGRAVLSWINDAAPSGHLTAV